MSDRSSIEWTDATWNPVTGCTRVSPGCGMPRFEGDLPGGCYAEALAERFRGTPGHYYEQGFDVQLRPAKLDQPLRWKTPRKVFVNSMSDLFHDAVPDEYIAKVFAVMAATPQHTYQVLTKRHGRMRSLLNNPEWRRSVFLRESVLDLHGPARLLPSWPLPNVWLGVSVETQQWADIRIPALMATPAAVHWISAEPLLGPVDLSWWLGSPEHDKPSGLDWVVAGGESGPGARPPHPDWFRKLRDQCQQGGIAFLLKQRGAYTWERPGGGQWPEPHLYVNSETGQALPEAEVPATGAWQGVWRVGKGKAGRELDRETWDEYPQAVTS